MQSRSVILVGVLAALLCSLSLSACNTVEGAGKDIQSGGKAIKDEAQEHK